MLAAQQAHFFCAQASLSPRATPRSVDPTHDVRVVGDGDVYQPSHVSFDAPEDQEEKPPFTVDVLADGSVQLTPNEDDNEDSSDEHDANLAEFMSESDLNNIADEIFQLVEQYRGERSDWEDGLNSGLEYLGLKTKDSTYPFAGASGAYDSVMLEAVLRDTATAGGELLPAAGPVKTQIIGLSSQDTEDQAARVQAWMNYYLMQAAPEWPEQSEQLLLWRAIAGSMFRKTYQDPILNRPVSPIITPDKFLVSFYADSELETCTCAIHILNLSYKDIIQRQITGFYRDVNLGEPEQPMPGEEQSKLAQKVHDTTGVTPKQSSGRRNANREYELFEAHIDYDLPGFEHEIDGEATGMPLSYIITVDKTSRTVLAIRRNWNPGDLSFKKNQYFTHFKFMPGLGFYGIGYAHILGNSAQSSTGLLRQMTDAETLAMFPGGVRQKGLKLDDNNQMVGPCEWVEIDTGGMPLNQAFVTLPYKGASPVSFQLWQAIRDSARGLASTTEMSVGDGRQDAPVGTTLALLEAANKLMSYTIKNGHRAFRKEFKLFHALFAEYLPEQPYPFPVQGGVQSIMKSDFSDSIDVIPVSDPNITSYAQRVTRAEGVMRMVQQDPQSGIDRHFAYQNMLHEMGMDDGKIAQMLPMPKEAVPLDPLTENQNMLTGKPVAVGPTQNHQAHIDSHQSLMNNPITAASAGAHIQEHNAAKMRVDVQRVLGIQLPPAGTQLPPQIENQLSVMVAQAMKILHQQQAQENGTDPTPAQIAMQEIQVEMERIQLDAKKIEATLAGKAYTDNLNFEAKERERKSRERIALVKSADQRHAIRHRSADNALGAFARTQFGGKSGKEKR